MSSGRGRVDQGWRVVLRDTVWPLGKVVTALVAEAERATVRVAVCPFGPVTVLLTLPSPRTVCRLMLAPFGPVVVDDTSPLARLVWRTTVWPSGPVRVLLRSRALTREGKQDKDSSAAHSNSVDLETAVFMTRLRKGDDKGWPVGLRGVPAAAEGSLGMNELQAEGSRLCPSLCDETCHG